MTLHPYRLCLIRQAWYLIARPTKEEYPKTYRAPRFKTLRALDTAAMVPDDFNVGAYLDNAWGVYRGEKSYDVELRFSKDAAALVTETRWHHTQQVERDRNGSATLRFTVDGLDEIIWWLLGWAGFVKVIKPRELRTMLTKQLRAGLKMNKDS
jgi:predicted DNA-binding transcriptional regulator YafY